MVGEYIPPQANATAAIGALADQITTVDNSNPKLILGDFNHTALSKELPKYKQQVTCVTREGKHWTSVTAPSERHTSRFHARPWFLRPRHDLPPALISPETETSETLRSKYQALGRRFHPASPRMSSVYGLGLLDTRLTTFTNTSHLSSRMAKNTSLQITDSS